MTPAPAKFRFDLDLGHRQERNSVVTESALAAMISNARAQGYNDGLADGERAAIVKAAERMAHAAEVLADHVASMSAALDAAAHNEAPLHALGKEQPRQELASSRYAHAPKDGRDLIGYGTGGRAAQASHLFVAAAFDQQANHR